MVCSRFVDVMSFKFVQVLYVTETRVFGLQCCVNPVVICFNTILTCDEQTNEWTDNTYCTIQSIVRVKTTGVSLQYQKALICQNITITLPSNRDKLLIELLPYITLA